MIVNTITVEYTMWSIIVDGLFRNGIGIFKYMYIPDMFILVFIPFYGGT